MTQVTRIKLSFNLSRRIKIRSWPLVSQREKYKGKAWGQLENTHEGRALRLSWNSRAGLLRISKSVLAAVRGSIG